MRSRNIKNTLFSSNSNAEEFETYIHHVRTNSVLNQDNVCKVCNKNNSLIQCKECNINYCKECYELKHNKIEHTKIMINNNNGCLKHSKPYLYYCNKDNELFCKECFNDHREHEIDKIENSTKEINYYLNDKLNQMNKNIQNYKRRNELLHKIFIRVTEKIEYLDKEMKKLEDKTLQDQPLKDWKDVHEYEKNLDHLRDEEEKLLSKLSLKLEDYKKVFSKE